MDALTAIGATRTNVPMLSTIRATTSSAERLTWCIVFVMSQVGKSWDHKWCGYLPASMSLWPVKMVPSRTCEVRPRNNSPGSLTGVSYQRFQEFMLGEFVEQRLEELAVYAPGGFNNDPRP